MKTRMNLKKITRITMSLMAAFILTPAFSGSQSDSANAGSAEAYRNLDRLQSNLMSDLEYTATDANDRSIDARIAKAYESLANFSHKAAESFRYNASMEDSNIASYNGPHGAFHQIYENTGRFERILAYTAPLADAGFTYHFESAKAIDDLESAAEVMRQSLAYRAALDGPVFAYDYENAAALEWVALQQMKAERLLAYKAPEDGDDAFTYDFEMALLLETIENNAEDMSDDICYEAPSAEAGFEFNYETALVEERLDGFQASTLEMLRYAAPENDVSASVAAGSSVACNTIWNMASPFSIETIRRSTSASYIKASY